MCVLSCRGSVLERLQSFLPQMAEANEKLRQQMENAPDGYFDIERVEEAQRVIEMVSFFGTHLRRFINKNLLPL